MKNVAGGQPIKLNIGGQLKIELGPLVASTCT